MIRVLNVVGNRPHMIKNAVLSKELRKSCNEIIVHTGQHYDYEMSDIFFKEFGLPEPNYNLGVGSGTHGEMTGKVMVGLEPILEKESPDVVLVHGDTDSTLAAALAAVKMGIPIAHVESGLRSYNFTMPEETNRVCVDHISRVLFCPCVSAYHNLELEGLFVSVRIVGDVMVDTLMQFKKEIEQSHNQYSGEEYVVATIHRDENTRNAEKTKIILRAFERYDGKIIFPMHPRTRIACATYKIPIPKNVVVIPPIGYFEMLKLVKDSTFIVTDSGGLQKEAYILKKPCITLRNETEWVDTLYGGWNKLVRVRSSEDILSTMRLCRNPANTPISAVYSEYYGSGDASKKIVEELKEVFDR